MEAAVAGKEKVENATKVVEKKEEVVFRIKEKTRKAAKVFQNIVR